MCVIDVEKTKTLHTFSVTPCQPIMSYIRDMTHVCTRDMTHVCHSCENEKTTLYTFSVTTCEPILRFGEISHHHVSIPYEVGALAYDTPHDSAAKRHDSCMSYIRDMTHVCL
jgi:hypothetical protein